MLAETLIDAEVMAGKLAKKIPKDTSFKGNRHGLVISSQDEITRKKSEAIKEMGFSHNQIHQFE